MMGSTLYSLTVLPTTYPQVCWFLSQTTQHIITLVVIKWLVRLYLLLMEETLHCLTVLLR